MEIKQELHEFCEGCTFMQFMSTETSYFLEAPGLLVSCANYNICAQLWDRLSTIRNDPPDLMEQIAAICREKGILVEEAVELFRKL